MRQSTVSRVGMAAALVLIAAVVIFVVPRGGPAEPTPTPIPTIGEGRMCVAAVKSLDSCDGVAPNPTFAAGDSLVYRIVMPFYEDGYVHVTISRMDGSSPSIVWTSDIQVIPNPSGVWNRIGPVVVLKAPQAGVPTTFQIQASSAGRVIAQSGFEIDTAGPS